jgi:hypothetical protein
MPLNSNAEKVHRGEGHRQNANLFRANSERLRCPNKSVHRSRRIDKESNDDAARIDSRGITGNGSWWVKRSESAVPQQK